MIVAHHTLTLPAASRGLHDITADVARLVARSRVVHGMVTLLLQHTSASLLIQENADPSARRDLEAWLDRLVPEQDPLYTHTVEGPDDMPAHVKTMLTAVTLTLPIVRGRLPLGTWQGVFLWEHRRRAMERRIILSIVGAGGDLATG